MEPTQNMSPLTMMEVLEMLQQFGLIGSRLRLRLCFPQRV